MFRSTGPRRISEGGTSAENPILPSAPVQACIDERGISIFVHFLLFRIIPAIPHIQPDLFLSLATEREKEEASATSADVVGAGLWCVYTRIGRLAEIAVWPESSD